MPISDDTLLDNLISSLIAALHASRSLHMDQIEQLVRMSLMELGRSVANAQTHDAQKPRKKKLPLQKKTKSAAGELSLVAPVVREPTGAGVTHAADTAIMQRRLGHPPIPRRRLPPRRTSSRG